MKKPQQINAPTVFKLLVISDDGDNGSDTHDGDWWS